MKLSYRTVDADNHYYETRDAFTRYIDPAYAERTLLVETDGGSDRIIVDGQPYLFSEPKFDKTNPPGSLLANLRDPQRKDYRSTFDAGSMLPAYQNRDKRLELMDDQGIEAAVLLPSLAVCVERPIRHDPALTDAVMRAFNRWLEDDWGYAYRDRIYAVPLISLLDVGLACRELTRVLHRGARLIHLSAGPVAGRSPADPHFDPFWSIVNEARIPVVFHIGDAGYNELFGAGLGREPHPARARDVGVSMGIPARGPSTHADAGITRLLQPFRTFPRRQGGQHRERLGLGVLPVEAPRQEEGHGPAGPVAGWLLPRPAE